VKPAPLILLMVSTIALLAALKTAATPSRIGEAEAAAKATPTARLRTVPATDPLDVNLARAEPLETVGAASMNFREKIFRNRPCRAKHALKDKRLDSGRAPREDWGKGYRQAGVGSRQPRDARGVIKTRAVSTTGRLLEGTS